VESLATSVNEDDVSASATSSSSWSHAVAGVPPGRSIVALGPVETRPEEDSEEDDASKSSIVDPGSINAGPRPSITVARTRDVIEEIALDSS